MFEIITVWLAGIGPSLAFFVWLFRDIPGDPYLDNDDSGRAQWWFLSFVLALVWPIAFAVMIGLSVDAWGRK